MLLKLAWRNIWRNKRRTLITTGSIVFAVLLAILLNSLKEGILIKMQENVVSFYSGAVQIHQNGYWDEQSLDNSMPLDDSLVATLMEHEEIHGVIARLESFALGASENYTKGCLVVGVQPELEPTITALDQKVSEGRYLSNGDQGVLVAEGLASYLKLTVGDTLVLIGQGYHGTNAAGKFPIIGLLHFANPELNKSMVYLSLATAQDLFAADGLITALVLDIDHTDKAEELAHEFEAWIGNEYEVMGWKTMLPELNHLLEGERAENVIFLFVLYMLIAFGIFGTILMMTMERKYEFGVLVAIGMRKIKLSSVVIIENVIISCLGALVGLILSIPVVGYFYTYPIKVSGDLEETYENFGFEPVFYFSIEPPIFYNQMLIVLSIALVLSVYPLLKITRLEPVTAMRS